MNSKSILSVFVLFLIGILATSVVSAVSVTIDEVKLNGDIITDQGAANPTVLDVERNDKVSVNVKLTGTADASNVQVEASISGYEYSDRESTSDASHVFDVKTGVTYMKKLTVPLPEKLDQDRYWLRVLVTDRNTALVQKNYLLEIDTARHSLKIKDVVFSPEDPVKAGRALLTTVRIKNVGEKDEEGIKVKVAIPDLGVSATDYIDKLEGEESTTSEELYLRIPTTAAPGEYDVVTTVEFDEGYESTSREDSVVVIGDEDEAPVLTPSVDEKTVLNVGRDSSDVAPGQTAVYPLVLTNKGTTSKLYVFSVSGVSGWADVKVEPSNLVTVGAGETATVSVSLTPSAGVSAGERSFVVKVQSEKKTVDVPLTAKIIGASAPQVSAWGKVKKALEVGLVVLVVLLVIIGLIVGFNKLKSDDDDLDDEEESGKKGQTYY